MGLLTSAAQLIVGPKTFQHDTVFKGKVRFEKDITRTKNAVFHLDKRNDVDVGTLKWLTTQVTVLNVNPADTDWHELDLASNLPVGAKAIFVREAMTSSVAGDEAYLAASSGGAVELDCRCQVANVYNDAAGVVLLTATRTIWYKATSANVVAHIVNLLGYYL